MKRIPGLLAFLTLSLFVNLSKAQDFGQMIKDWERAKVYTQSYLEAMPEDGYAFKLTPPQITGRF